MEGLKQEQRKSGFHKQNGPHFRRCWVCPPSWDVFLSGAIAHLGYLHHEYIRRRGNAVGIHPGSSLCVLSKLLLVHIDLISMLILAAAGFDKAVPRPK